MGKIEEYFLIGKFLWVRFIFIIVYSFFYEEKLILILGMLNFYKIN